MDSITVAMSRSLECFQRCEASAGVEIFLRIAESEHSGGTSVIKDLGRCVLDVARVGRVTSVLVLFLGR